MIRKAYLDTPLAGGVIQTHYRTAGKGKPLVLLHPSPLSSAFMVPVIQTAEDHFRVLALDTPGYGASEPLPTPGDDLTPYVDWLDAVLDAFGLGSVVLYGSATGAQIAIEFACAHPARVEALVLENAVHFEDAERQDIMARYFPSLAPQADGAHLAEAWRMADQLFRGFPWYEAPVDGPSPPVELVHATAMAYLVAGEDYARAYQAAFNNERAERLAQVPVPTSVMRWDGSILKAQADRFDRFEWPAHITMHHSEATPEARFSALRSVFEALA
ncbi:MAG: alpha/beta hydrolase [Pseudomonadota bacterium]